MRIFFSVGEPSGDQHAAHLIESLRRRNPGIEAVGYGGPHMEQAGCKLDFQLTNLAVMGFSQVLPHLKQFYDLVQNADRIFRSNQKPDAVVLVDFPGFNWHIARKAKAAGIPVFYYLPPQIWAWAGWRINKLRKYVDHVLCGLSFEPDWYAKRGLKVDFVGHPFFDEVAEKKLNAEFVLSERNRPGRIVGVLPGSRNLEVHRNWSLQLEVMARTAKKHPDVRFLVASYKPHQRDFCEKSLAEWQAAHPEIPPLPVEFHLGRTSEIIEIAQCCLMVSGSVSLEMLSRRTPAVVMYRMNPSFYYSVIWMAQVPYMTLVNLMANQQLFPEDVIVLRPKRSVENLTQYLDDWLTHPEKLAAVREQLGELCRSVASTGATARTAEAILRKLSTAAPDAGRRAA